MGHPESILFSIWSQGRLSKTQISPHMILLLNAFKGSSCRRKNPKPMEGMKDPPQSDPSLSLRNPTTPVLLEPSHHFTRPCLWSGFPSHPGRHRRHISSCTSPQAERTPCAASPSYPNTITPTAFHCGSRYRCVALPPAVLNLSVTFASSACSTEPGR